LGYILTKDDVIKLLEKNKNERGMANWNNSNPSNGKWTSYGIGLTQLKAIAKQIGRNHELASDLWQIPNYECKTLATIIDDPKKMTAGQAEMMVDDLNFWILAHSFCSGSIVKAPFMKETAEKWMIHNDRQRRSCGYRLLYQLAQNYKKIDDSYFEKYLNIIERDLQAEENFVKDAMNNAMMAIGLRSAGLNRQALKAAKKIGKVEVDYGDNSCQAVDVIKHLTSDRIKDKFKSV